MSEIDQVKEKVRYRYKNDPYVHVDVSSVSPKLSLKNAKVKIVGAYSHIFQIEECTDGTPKRHTFQYTDIVTKHLVIRD